MLLKIYGLALKYASLRLKKNYDIVLEAVKSNGLSIIYSDVYIDNCVIISNAIKSNSEVLKYLSTQYRDNYAIVSHAIKKNNNLFKYASEKI